MTPARTVIDLDAKATVLDAAERIAAAPDGIPLVLVVPAGAPFGRNAAFLDVARQEAGRRRVAIVSSEARARSLAASVHIPAYSSLGAVEREEMDPTERLGAPARAARAAAAPQRTGGGLAPSRRMLGIAASVLAALVLLAAIAVPSAAVTLAPAASPMPSTSFALRAGPGGDIAAQPLTATIATKVTGAATGSRTEDTKATGSVRFSNGTTNDIRIAKGTIVQTAGPNPVRFQTTEDKTLPRSVIIIDRVTVTVGQVDAAVEALAGGPSGNVDANRIVVTSNPTYSVTNPQKTSGGDTKKIPVVVAEDYTAATTKLRVDGVLAAAAEDQKTKWKAQLGGDTVVYVAPPSLTSQGGLSDVVGKEVAAFDVPVTATVQGFAIPGDQPAKAAAERYRSMAAPGNVLDERTAQLSATYTVGADGVTFKVTASGQQYPRLDAIRIRGAVAGHGVDEARAMLEAQGLHVVDLRLSPSWWPRMPLLDARIAVN